MTIRRTAALVLVVLVASHACSSRSPEDVESQAPVPVTTARAETGSITALVHANGIVSPAPGADQLVIAPEAARIAEITKADGERVRRGEVLVRFEIPSVAADAARQQSEIVRARARIDAARAAEARARDLFARGVAARRDEEQARTDPSDARADLESAQAAAAAATTVAGRSIVRAAFDGIVARRAHNPGDLVEPSAADLVLRVVDPARVEVVATLPVADAPRVRSGAAARIIDAPEGTPPLRVIARAAAVQPGTTLVTVRLAFASPPAFPVGAPVQVAIDAETHTHAVSVPAPAVVHEGPDTIVFVVTAGKAERHAVVTGLEAGDRVEISSGLSAGDVVITSGQNGLPDGAPVTIASRADSGEPTETPEHAAAKPAVRP
jgi:RND family efflux transporter MFP subunit